MNRTTIINELIKKIKGKTYLEIGVRKTDDNFNSIVCEIKHGVDPNVNTDTYTQGVGYQTTSDDYFAGLSKDVKYDVIFIDGWHMQEQVDKDIQNSLKHLSGDGYIVLHDCNPRDEFHEGANRCGTVWRSVYNLRKNSPELKVCVVDTDYGCGLICRGQGTPLHVEEPEVLNYSFLDKYRKEILNLIDKSEFVSKVINA
jgi:hypothetical protein